MQSPKGFAVEHRQCGHTHTYLNPGKSTHVPLFLHGVLCWQYLYPVKSQKHYIEQYVSSAVLIDQLSLFKMFEVTILNISMFHMF